ncbi:NAD-dependent epimerase/dehydratase family protein [Couchioplanes caeruleus]|uniref:Epimerase n=2 Tax=Couchioplanes caeruleus TaxID=56438 RepID=A0A1K0FD01_9ACTN|nr:NAD-dependent epimerase/dehydratase family protein [Couchioplanes caeruleus]OJF10719.1 epimerase [Couchioplanes caeruleus subsp. caeruleus]ROP31293.1 nucleoside-diphosphate-sugar epimerase [Couchioplanes caeruleus]
MHIAITGGAGVLGRNLIQRLVKEGHRVTSLDLTFVPEYTNYQQIIGDIRDADIVRSAISGADMVVHAAAALPSYKPQQIRSISVEGTRTVLAACHAARIERVVHVSSSAVYGLPDVVPTTEDYPRERVDPYNCAKIDAELICEDYRDKGMCIPILRPKTFLGPHRLGIFSMLFEWADEGHHFPLMGGGHFRSQMLDVDDLVEVVSTVLRLPDASVNSEFNVAATEFTTLHDDFQAVLDAAGHGKRVISLPAKPAIGALRALEMLGVSPVYKRLIYKLSRDAYVSTARAEKVLGFAPKHSNQDTIIRTFRWWQSQKSSEQAVVKAGKTSREPWKQGVLGLAKVVF